MDSTAPPSGYAGVAPPGYPPATAPPTGYPAATAPPTGYPASTAPPAGYPAPSTQPAGYPGSSAPPPNLPPSHYSGARLPHQSSIASVPTSTLELSIKCHDLCDTDMLSKSDPLCVMFQKPRHAPHQPSGRDMWVEVGRTEMLKDTLNPEFQTKFVVNYNFEERQVVKFEVYDWDTNSTRLSDQDFLGRCETSLGTIVSAVGKQFVSVLKETPRRDGGRILVTAEELQANKEVVNIQLAASKLDKKDFFGKSDPFVVISKSSSSGPHIVVRRTEVIKNTLNPTWARFSVPVRDLCNNNYDRPLKFDVYDWNSSGKDDFIGSFTTDLKTLSTAAIENKQFPCINEKKKGKKNYKDSGHVYVKSIKIETELTFLDYIQGGTAMNFSVAVDFTASNGDPRKTTSLHHMTPGFPDNQYTTAIRSVGEIIADYDSDKMFPALGFGARIPPTGQVSHEFFLNLRPDNPYCTGVDGLLQAYFTALQNVTLYGPTNFAPVIKHVTRFAQSYQDGKQYFVLLIITDGIITDMDNTIHAIIEASVFPMSIIIVGVGNEDFSSMEALDSDDKLLRQSGRVAERDIVQFVEMRKFVGPGGMWDKELLAKEVLAEIPKQVVSWMKKRGIKPVNT